MRTLGKWNDKNESKLEITPSVHNDIKRENDEYDHQVLSDVNGNQEDLDILYNNLKHLNKNAKDLGKELDRQAPIINNLNNEMDNANIKMNRVNGILKKQINR